MTGGLENEIITRLLNYEMTATVIPGSNLSLVFKALRM